MKVILTIENKLTFSSWSKEFPLDLLKGIGIEDALFDMVMSNIEWYMEMNNLERKDVKIKLNIEK